MGNRIPANSGKLIFFPAQTRGLCILAVADWLRGRRGPEARGLSFPDKHPAATNTTSASPEPIRRTYSRRGPDGTGYLMDTQVRVPVASPSSEAGALVGAQFPVQIHDRDDTLGRVLGRTQVGYPCKAVVAGSSPAGPSGS